MTAKGKAKGKARRKTRPKARPFLFVIAYVAVIMLDITLKTLFVETT
jgi:hypothetical protein